MCTVISSSSVGDETPRRGRPRAGAGTGAAGLGDAGAAFVHPHRDRVRLGTGLDDLEVDVGHRRPEAEQIDDGDVVDADHGVRVADAEVADRAQRIACRRGASRRLVDRRHGPHVDAASITSGSLGRRTA